MPSENVRITCSTEDLDAKLSKSMKLLGAHHDEYGRLVNAEGKYISGLSQARIKMGDWIDAQGRARDAAGGFLDGLTATEQKLRMYKDELGNVYTAEGQLVRQSEELTKAHQDRLAAAEAEVARVSAEVARRQEELATAGQRGTKSLLSGARGAAKMANNLSLMIGVLGGGNEGLNKFGQNIVIATQTFSQFALAMKTLPKFIQGFKLLTIATQGQTAAQTILNAVSGNWVVLIAGGLAAGTLAYKTLSKSTKDVSDKTAEAAKQVDALTIAYQRLGEARGESGGFGAGAVAAGVSEIDVLEEHKKKVDELSKSYDSAAKSYAAADKALRDYESTTNSAEKNMDRSRVWRFLQWGGGKIGNAFGGNFDTETQGHKVDREADAANQKRGEAEAALKEATDQYARAVQDMIRQDLPRDEMRELQARAEKYAEALQSANLDEEARANIQAALIENQRKQAELIDKQNQEAERAAEEERKKAEERLAEAERKLGDKFAEYADGSALFTAQEKAAANLQKTIETWRENAEAAGKSEAELNAAISNLTKEYNQKRLQEFMDANNLKVREEQTQDALAQYEQTLRKIKEAEEAYGLEAAEAEKLRTQAEKDYADALAKKAEDEAKQRESRLNELGITSLREQMKSPLEKFLEQQSKIQTAQQEGLIGAAEAAKMNAKLAQDYWSQIQSETGGTEDAADTFEKESYRAATDMTAGSNELYQAMTQRENSTERYQTDMKKNVTSMAQNTADNNELLQAIQGNLAQVMRGLGVV